MIVSELPVPALFTRMSMPSKAAATRAQARSTSEALETSAAIASAFTPCDAAISPASRSARTRSRATIATSTPSAASARATARPMPTLPPVMTARLPLSSRSMSCSHGHCTAPAEARGRSGHFQVLVLHDWTCLDQLVYVNERDERAPALVGDARLDVGGIHLEEEPGHLLERRRPPRVDARAQPGRPCQPDEIAVVGIVIRVVVRDENVSQVRQRNTGEHQLARDAIAAIDHVRTVVRDDDLSGRRADLSRPGATTRAEQDEPGLAVLPFRAARQPRRTDQQGGACESSASADRGTHVGLGFSHKWDGFGQVRDLSGATQGVSGQSYLSNGLRVSHRHPAPSP